MMFVRRISLGEIVPTWYGQAYLDPLRPYQSIFVPIPFNLVIRFVRAMWWRLQKGIVGVTAGERFKCKLYQQAQDDARERWKIDYDSLRKERQEIREEWKVIHRLASEPQETSKC